MKRFAQKILALALGIVILSAVTSISPKAEAATATSRAGIVSMATGSLNVRSGATSTGTVLTRLPKGTYVTLLYKSGSFWRVEYATGKYGYAYAAYIKTVSGTSTSYVDLSTGTLNIRTGPSSSYAIKSVLYNGKIVVILSYVNSEWCKILYNGTQIGYTRTIYLKPTASKMNWPAPASAKIVQYFSSGTHLGVDIAPAIQGVAGDRIVSAASGTVVYAGALNGYGYVVYVNSYVGGKYIQTRYAHLKSPPIVGAGQTVSAGQTLGYMGQTGDATGVHLHFEVRIRSSSAECIANSASTPVNPLNYVTP
ncbi:MAG: peptidoglycan DD-metalloendopeptidase family protein [Clostridiales bacterium]|nr:peptidoglycan DD-metalloendopeptidase family protein [Clostridiales bacterium]